MTKKFEKKIKELKKTFRRERFLVLSNIVVMIVTFLILGFFISTAVGFNTAIQSLEDQAQLTVFFEDPVSEEAILELRENLVSDEKIREVVYVSKEDAFNLFTEVNKNEPVLLEAITPDILPASLEIKTEKLEYLAGFAEQLSAIEGVEDVKFFRDVVDNFRYWARIITILGVLLVVVFLTISFSLVISTLRTTIDHKAKEIGIMKLVGATDAYVRTPLVFQGTVFGFIAALIAAFFMVLIFTLLHFLDVVSFSALVVLIFNLKVAIWAFILILAVLLIGLGGLLGYLGSLAAIKKYLRY